jgi:hypothetical protein
MKLLALFFKFDLLIHQTKKRTQRIFSDVTFAPPPTATADCAPGPAPIMLPIGGAQSQWSSYYLGIIARTA